MLAWLLPLGCRTAPSAQLHQKGPFQKNQYFLKPRRHSLKVIPSLLRGRGAHRWGGDTVEGARCWHCHAGAIAGMLGPKETASAGSAPPASRASPQDSEVLHCPSAPCADGTDPHSACPCDVAVCPLSTREDKRLCP